MKPRTVLAIVPLAVASLLVGFSMLFLSRAMSIIDYGGINLEGVPCDSCEFTRAFLVNYSVIFGVAGATLGGLAIWVIGSEKVQWLIR